MKKQLICGSLLSKTAGISLNRIENEYQERVLQGRMGIKEDSAKNWYNGKDREYPASTGESKSRKIPAMRWDLRRTGRRKPYMAKGNELSIDYAPPFS